MIKIQLFAAIGLFLLSSGAIVFFWGIYKLVREKKFRALAVGLLLALLGWVLINIAAQISAAV